VKSYVIRDDSFGLIGCGCRVECSDDEICVYPQDGLKKRLRFVPQKIDLEAAQGEVDQVTMSDDAKWMELSLSHSTGVVKKAELEIKGLDKGEYLIRYGSSADRKLVSDALKLSLPIADAKPIRIEKCV
jgi:hypothetical protein